VEDVALHLLHCSGVCAARTQKGLPIGATIQQGSHSPTHPLLPTRFAQRIARNKLILRLSKPLKGRFHQPACRIPSVGRQ
jgi:hypothetical protein